MKIKGILKIIIQLGVTILFLGCENEKIEQKINIIEKTKEALGSTNEIGCSLEKNNSNQECNEKQSSSSFILGVLTKDNNKTQNKHNSSLELKFNKLVEEYDKEKKSKLSIKEELRNLVNSTKDRADIKNELESLVDSVEKSKLNTKDIKESLLNLVNSADKQISSIENRKKSIESLVNSIEKNRTTLVKRVTNPAFKDISKNKVKILKTEENFFIIKVEKGDTLSSLALKYYGDASKYKLIYEVNKDKINNKKIIHSGTTLLIPKI